MEAVQYLGYRNREDYKRSISEFFEKKGNFVHRRMSEFDVYFPHRVGQTNRPIAPIVKNMHAQLNPFTLQELGDLVKQLLSNKEILISSNVSVADTEEITLNFSDNDIESYVNVQDLTATRLKKQKEVMERVFDYRIINDLKKFYSFSCQICGLSPTDTLGYKIVEAHHILQFSVSQDNSSNNIMIVCPNHHRLIHKANPVFDRDSGVLIYGNNQRENLTRNFHLF